MRIAVGVLRVQAHALQHADDAVVTVLVVLSQLVDVDGLAHNVADGHAGVQGSIGVLEHDLHLTAVGQHVHRDLLLGIGQLAGVVDHLTVIDDAAVGGLVQAQQGTAGGGLTAAGLTYQTQRLALVDEKAHVVHSLDVAALLAEAACVEVLLEVLDLNQFFLLAHSAFPPLPSNSAFCSSQHWV